MTSSQPVYFDVSGKVMWTMPATIAKSPVLQKLVQSKRSHVHRDQSRTGDRSHPILVDDDPEAFRQMLGLLRDDDFPFDFEDFEYELQKYSVEYSHLVENVTDDEDFIEDDE